MYIYYLLLYIRTKTLSLVSNPEEHLNSLKSMQMRLQNSAVVIETIARNLNKSFYKLQYIVLYILYSLKRSRVRTQNFSDAHEAIKIQVQIYTKMNSRHKVR